MLFGTLTAVFALVRGALSGTSFAGPVLTVPVHAIPLPLPSSELALLQIHICGEFGETSPEYLRALAALSAAAGPDSNGGNGKVNITAATKAVVHPEALIQRQQFRFIQRNVVGRGLRWGIEWRFLGPQRLWCRQRSSRGTSSGGLDGSSGTGNSSSSGGDDGDSSSGASPAAARPTGFVEWQQQRQFEREQHTATRAARTTCRER